MTRWEFIFAGSAAALGGGRLVAATGGSRSVATGEDADATGRVPPVGECGVGSTADRVDWRTLLPALAADGTRWLVVKPTVHPDSIEDLKASYSYLKGLT